jgi:hypothetical protein
MGIDALSILAVQRPPIREKAFNLLLKRCIDQGNTNENSIALFIFMNMISNTIRCRYTISYH